MISTVLGVHGHPTNIRTGLREGGVLSFHGENIKTGYLLLERGGVEEKALGRPTLSAASKTGENCYKKFTKGE